MNQKTNARFAADLQQDQRAEALVEQIGKAMLEHYNMELSKKVTHTKKQKALTCRFNGGSVPYGYQIDTHLHYQINPDQAPVVLEIFQRFAANVPMAELLRDLEAKGVRNAKGNCYTRKTLTKLLSNRIYIGEYRYTDIVIPGGVPAIVDKALFDAVAARLANPNCR
jgi:hypothetical protein